MASKEDRVYLPLLNAFIQEVQRAVAQDSLVSQRLVAYLLSKYDFYKIISVDGQRLTTIQSFNMYGTLNLPSRAKKADISVPIVQLPTELLYIDLKKGSKTTVLACFENGWQFSFRIHNVKDKVETSLKFDIQIVGMPADLKIKFNCPWHEVG